MSATTRTNLNAILSDIGSDMTLAALARSLYRYTAAGISLAARLSDGSPVWSGDKRMHDPTLLDSVAALGVSSIVEDSDAEVPLQWLDLEGLTPKEAVERFAKLCHDVDAEACRLWVEAHEEGSE